MSAASIEHGQISAGYGDQQLRVSTEFMSCPRSLDSHRVPPRHIASPTIPSLEQRTNRPSTIDQAPVPPFNTSPFFGARTTPTRPFKSIPPARSKTKQQAIHHPTCSDEVSKPGGHGSHRKRTPDNGEHFLPAGRMYVPATATAVQPKPRQSRRPSLAPSGGRFSSQRHADSAPGD